MAEEAVSAAEQEFEGSGPQFHFVWMMWARALLLEAKGQPEAAFGVLSEGWALCARAGIRSECGLIGPDLVRLSLAIGDLVRAEEVVIAVEGVASDNPSMATLRGSALRCRGLLEDRPGPLLEAVAAYRQGPRPIARALACEDAAAALAEAARMDEARPLLYEALELYDRAGASRLAAQGEARLRALGIRRGLRGSRKRGAVGKPSRRPNAASRTWWPGGCRTPRLPNQCSFPDEPSRRTSPMLLESWG